MVISFPLLSLRYHGGVRIITAIANYLAERGHRVYVITPRDRFSPLFPLSEKVGIKLTPSVGKLGDISHLLSLFYLSNLIPTSQFIIPSFFPTFYPAYISSLRKRGKIIYFIQGYEYRFYRGLRSIGARLSYLFAKDIVTVSMWLKEKLRDDVGLKDITVINPGIERKSFFPEPSGELVETKRYPAILFIAQRGKIENIKDFCKTVKFLTNRVEVEFWIVYKEESIKPYFSEFRNVRFFNPSNDRELRYIYSSSDLFVSNSRLEGFPLPPLEAMSCGIPVVLTDSGGVRDYIIPSKNAVMVKSHEPILMAETIERVVKDRELRGKLVKAGFETAGKFDIRYTVEKFESYLLEQL